MSSLVLACVRTSRLGRSSTKNTFSKIRLHLKRTNVMDQHPLFLPHQLSFAETFSTTVSQLAGENITEEEPTQSTADLTQVKTLIQRAIEVLEPDHKVSIITVEKSVTAVCEAFEDLNDENEKKSFLIYLAQQSVNRKNIDDLTREYANKTDNLLAKEKIEDQLRAALVPKYAALFQKIGQLEGGVKFLVDLRSHLIIAVKDSSDLDSSTQSSLRSMNKQLRQTLSHWFSVGFLELNLVNWQSPCSMLQKISDYEAVHPVRNWTDLKARVGPYRRCFVYTHRSMPGEPIVVLHVALTKEIPESISSVVKHHRLVKRFSVETVRSHTGYYQEGEDPSWCECAIFYSITSTQTGLQGIELGTYLIKQAVKKLKEEIPGLTLFSTLSPIPGFRSWLLATINSKIKEGDGTTELLLKSERKALASAFHCQEVDALANLQSNLKTNSWAQDDAKIEALQPILMRLCARYLYKEKRRGMALDGVANFHLRNGAVLWRLNWRGDLSARGLSSSCGIMVNYKYCLDEMEQNSTDYQEKQLIKAGDLIKHISNLTD